MNPTKKVLQGVRTALEETSIKGEFTRVDSGYRNWIKKGSEQFPPQKGRYHLYISYACPWAHRCLIVRNLKGLQDIIGLSIVHPTWQITKQNQEHYGWAFGEGPYKNPNGFGEFTGGNATIEDPILGAKFIRDIYESVNDTIGKYSVPVLYDIQTKQIINNESSEIIQMLNSEFNEFSNVPELDLNPQNVQSEQQKQLDELIYDRINNGVYRCGFAQSQEAYETAFNELFEQLEVCEQILSKQRYLNGNQLTLSDIRLWVTLVRFDEVYVVYFKTNKKFIHQYPNLLNYCRDIYQYGNIAETLNMHHIKTHYYTSHAKLNNYGIIPVGCGFEQMLKEKHNRYRF